MTDKEKAPKDIKAKIGMSRDNHGTVRMEITDEKSGNRIINLEMNLESLGLFITGLHGVEVDATMFDTTTVGMERELFKIEIDKDKDWPYDKEEQAKRVKNHFYGMHFDMDGWRLFDLGTTTQQNTPGKHFYTAVRFV